VAQFRVEFVIDEASGMYLAELYHPENPSELIVRTEALYPTQAAAVLGVVQIFKDAVLQFPGPGEAPKRAIKVKKKPAKKPARAKKKSARKAAKKGRKKKS
jgi:hypothetical protein